MEKKLICVSCPVGCEITAEIDESVITRVTGNRCPRGGAYANQEAIGNVDAFERTDVEFHFVIASIGNNPVFAALHTAIAEWLSNQRKVSLRVPGVEASAYNSHEDIHKAIASREPEKAWHAMDRHLRDIMEQFEKGSQHDDA